MIWWVSTYYMYIQYIFCVCGMPMYSNKQTNKQANKQTNKHCLHRCTAHAWNNIYVYICSIQCTIYTFMCICIYSIHTYMRLWTIEVVIFSLVKPVDSKIYLKLKQFWGLHRFQHSGDMMGHQIFATPNSSSQTTRWKTIVKPGSLYYQPKQCTVIKGIPQNYHGFASFDPKKNILRNLMLISTVCGVFPWEIILSLPVEYIGNPIIFTVTLR